jgi:hypothetical protein
MFTQRSEVSSSPGSAEGWRSTECLDLERHGVRAAIQATEVFPVACAQLEEGRDRLTVGGLQALLLEDVNGGEIRRMGLVVDRDFFFGHQCTLPLAQGWAQAGTQYRSGDRGLNGGWESAG